MVNMQYGHIVLRRGSFWDTQKHASTRTHAHAHTHTQSPAFNLLLIVSCT